MQNPNNSRFYNPTVTYHRSEEELESLRYETPDTLDLVDLDDCWTNDAGQPIKRCSDCQDVKLVKNMSAIGAGFKGFVMKCHDCIDIQELA